MASKIFKYNGPSFDQRTFFDFVAMRVNQVEPTKRIQRTTLRAGKNTRVTRALLDSIALAKCHIEEGNIKRNTFAANYSLICVNKTSSELIFFE